MGWRGMNTMNLIEMIAANMFRKTGETKKLSVPGQVNYIYEVYAIPLKYLYYNDHNGRINTAYKKHKAEKGDLKPEIGDSEYNRIFEGFIFESNRQATKTTFQSIKDKAQQEPGVVLPDGRVIDGNRRFTALRMFEREDGIPKEFNAVVLKLDASSKIDSKIIKELELDLQLGREERVSYDPIDRIFDVYNTIEVENLMTADEYKKASGAGNTKGIKRDIRLAELILKFIRIVSPGGDPIDKFYLARDLQLDGPIEEIERTINKLHSKDKETITDAVLVTMALSKTDIDQKAPTLAMRDLKNNVLNNPEIIDYWIDAVDDKTDVIIEAFEDNPIQSSNDLKLLFNESEELLNSAEKFVNSTNRLIYKGNIDQKRTRILTELGDILDNLNEIDQDDFSELTTDEFFMAKDTLQEISDRLFKLRKDLKL